MLAVLSILGILVFFWIRKAYMIQALALANLAVFILMLIAGQIHHAPFGLIQGTPFLQDLAYRPIDLAEGNILSSWKMLSAAFLHANFLHLAGNLLVLLMVGMAFEDRMGRGRILIIYVTTAITAVLLHVAYTALVEGRAALAIPLVGASGAVFGLLGAFASTYPHDRIPMWIIILLPRVPVILGATILMMLEGLLLFGGPASSVARVAHLGGAVGGAIIGPILKAKMEATTDTGTSSQLDIEALSKDAPDVTQQRLIRRLRENMDEPEARQAWLERVITTIPCHQCDATYATVRGTKTTCPQGHHHNYALTK